MKRFAICNVWSTQKRRLSLASRVGRGPGKFTSGTGRVSDPGSSKKAGKKTSILRRIKWLVLDWFVTKKWGKIEKILLIMLIYFLGSHSLWATLYIHTFFHSSLCSVA